LKKQQIKNLELKTTISKIKNSVDEFNGRSEIAEERIDNLKD
jgi:hypothetical protein